MLLPWIRSLAARLHETIRLRLKGRRSHDVLEDHHPSSDPAVPGDLVGGPGGNGAGPVARPNLDAAPGDTTSVPGKQPLDTRCSAADVTSGFEFTAAPPRADGTLGTLFAGDGGQAIPFAASAGFTDEMARALALAGQGGAFAAVPPENGCEGNWTVARGGNHHADPAETSSANALDPGLAHLATSLATAAPASLLGPSLAPRGITATLVTRGKKALWVEVRCASTGGLKTAVLSPFQPPRFGDIAVTTMDLNGDGAGDLVVVTATRKGKKQLSFIAV
jgi:hypothetical protein